MIPTVSGQVDELARAEGGPGAGERALMRAVLEDAVRCLAGEIGPVRERPQLAADARRWLVEGDRRWPFSFENICDVLGFDADRIRTRLLRDAPILPLADEPDAILARRRRREVPPEHEIVRMIREGHPLRVVAETFGISISKASILSCGLASRMKAERDEEIRELRRAGWTHRALAKHFRLSRIRIMRICARRSRPESDAGRTAA
jgi:hypothetical protein